MLFFPLLIIFLLLLSSCSVQKSSSTFKSDSEADISREASAGAVTNSREAVFVYSRKKDLQRRLILKVGGEPCLFPAGYVQLVGVVLGDKPTVCLEIAGRGLALEKGEKIDAYRITRIESDHAILEK